MNKRYIVDCEWHEHPWWYGERACLGMLASAVWKAGGIALEEFSWKKTDAGRRGRCDLWIKHSRVDFWCEAKVAYVMLRHGKIIDVSQVQRMLQKATDDANKVDIRKVQDRQKLALCFVPMNTKRYWEADLPEVAKDCVNKLLKDVKHDFAAPLLYPALSKGKSALGNGKDICAGIVLLGRLA